MLIFYRRRKRLYYFFKESIINLEIEYDENRDFIQMFLKKQFIFKA